MRQILTFVVLFSLTAGPIQDQARAQDDQLTMEIAIAGPNGINVMAGERDPRLDAADAVYQEAIANGFKGQIGIDLGDLLLSYYVSPEMAREGYGVMFDGAALWPLASITKQFLASRMVSELDRSEFDLDTPISKLVPNIERGKPMPTIRQLLQHRSGLRNPDSTPQGANGWPAFYNDKDAYGLEWCLKGRSAPPSEGWSENNCDYIVLGAAFQELSFASAEYMLGVNDENGNRTRAMINADNADTAYAMRAPERDVLPAFGASGALAVNLQDILWNNWGLLKSYDEATGAEKEFWKGDPERGNMALGHWVYQVTPPRCVAPITVSESQGEIGQYRLRNIMLPESKQSLVIATVDPDFEYGEISTGQGFMASAIAALACAEGKAE